MCWEFPPQMALIISCDVINNDLVVKFYIFILYLNLCNIFRWDNFLYRKDFYIERIYCQYLLYIYCHVFVAFLRIYWFCFPLSFPLPIFKTIIWHSQRQNLSVSTKHGIYMEHMTLQFGPSTVQYSQVIKFKTVASFCVLRISTTDGADEQLWFDQ